MADTDLDHARTKPAESPIEDEIKALTACVAALVLLDERARVRVLTYLWRRFGQ